MNDFNRNWLLHGKRNLFTWDESPTWIHDNELIRGSFRPSGKRDKIASLRSIFALHNETTNIWTHLVFGFILQVGVFYHLFDVTLPAIQPPMRSGDWYMWYAFAAGSIACMGFSATFHIFMNFSATAFRRLVVLDYSGIVVQNMTQLVLIHYLLECLPKIQVVVMSISGCACLVGLVVVHVPKLMTPEYRSFRTIVFTALGATAWVPTIVYGVFIAPGCTSCWHIFWSMWRSGGCYLIGAFIYAKRFPEAYFPAAAKRGVFNVWVHSHTLMHICATTATISFVYAFLEAHRYLRSDAFTCPGA